MYRWLPPWGRRPNAPLRLFCIPYAGGSASAFASWPRLLPPVIDVCAVQLPGRGARISEPACNNLRTIVERLALALRPLLDRPFALFGHSMGALVAFETARYLESQRWGSPACLYVSGRRAPHLPDTDLPPTEASDAEFLEFVRQLNGTPSEVLDDVELMRLLMPTLRADFEAIRTYVFQPGPPLTCPITVLGGYDDDESADSRLESWCVHTSVPETDVLVFPGDHFFIHSAATQVVAALTQQLAAHIASDDASAVSARSPSAIRRKRMSRMKSRGSDG